MFLDRIAATKRQEVDLLRERLSVQEAERGIAGMPPCRGFERMLTQGKKRSMGLIAEVKKASPSKGLIREDFHPAAIAAAYERAGADCLSVLTDTDYFQGSNEYLGIVKTTVALPILRKDFTIDPLQIYEARLIGADAVLLIAALLDDKKLRELYELARALGLDALVEVHNLPELERTLALGATLVGINNRDLHTFTTDLHTTEALIAHVPAGLTVVSESGISKPDDVRYLYETGARAVLIGEHFMRQPSVEDAVYALMGQQTELKSV